MRALWDTLRLFVGHVFVTPVREGRIRDVGWPQGLKPLALLGSLGFAAAVLLALGAEWLRSVVDLTQPGEGTPPLPRTTLWFIAALAALAISLAQTGAIHVRAWLRWGMTGFTVLVLLAITLNDYTWISRAYSIAAAVGIIVLVSLRQRRAFAWWEFCVIAGLVFTSFAVAITTLATVALPLGYDLFPALLILVLIILGQLAVPAATAAGASVAELAVSSAAWVADSIKDRLGLVAIVIVLGLVGVWRIVDVVPLVIEIANDPGAWYLDLASATGFIALIAASWLAFRAIRTRAVPLIGELTASMARLSLPISLVLTLSIPLVVVTLPVVIVASFMGQSWITQLAYTVVAAATGTASTAVVLTVMGVLLVVLAFLEARRGRATTPELLFAVGVANSAIGIGILVGQRVHWSQQALTLVATIVALGLLCWILVTRRWTLNRFGAITAALLIAALFTHRDFLADPLATLTNSTATAIVLIGLVWGFLSGNAVTAEDSRSYPRASRVLLALSNHLFVVVVLAFTLLARDPELGLNLANSTELGAQGFGDALIACALVTAFVATARDREIV